MNFIIQKLKNKHTFLKKLPNWAKLSSLILREQEETITKYLAPNWKINGRLNGKIHAISVPRKCKRQSSFYYNACK